MGHVIHLKFKVKEASCIQFKDTPDGPRNEEGFETFEFYWSDDQGETWEYQRDWSDWRMPAGDYLVSFPAEHYTPVFGDGIPQLASQFTNIEFTSHYMAHGVDFSGMFQGCNSLEHIDITNLFRNTETTTINFESLFSHRHWRQDSVYQVGDTVTHNDKIYVSNTDNASFEPGTGGNGWVDIYQSNFVPCGIRPLPKNNMTKEVRDITAGISKEDTDLPD